MTAHSEVIAFWHDAGAARWFARDDGFDERFHGRFAESHHAAARCAHEGWMETAEGALALVILLDQFPRNCFRGSAHSYATDGLARHYAGRAIGADFDLQVDSSLRMFFYLPFEHSESRADQDRSMELFGGIGDTELMKYAQLHRDLIERFGRFPHRNAALGRDSTPEELDYLASGGFSG